jgi:FAD/FMN-containing dehydrogenase
VTPRLDRRAFLLAAGAAALTGCSGSSDSAFSSPPSPRPTATRAQVHAPTPTQWGRLARSVQGSLATPSSPTYDEVRLVQNPRFDGARPLAVLSVASPDDVATGLAFAQDHALPVAIRSGGHSYPGWSAGDGRLVIDVRPLDDVALQDRVVTVGAGAALLKVYETVGRLGRAVAAGSCPTVGIAGLAQGGGVGVLSREHGLTCDQVSSVDVVLADGRQVTASAAEEPDLFWALRGGGGGHLGVVTSFTLSTFATPAITRAYLQWPLAAADQVVPAWLATSASADRRLWSTLKLLGGQKHAAGPVLALSATWTGPPSGLDRALQPLLSQVPATTVDNRTTEGYVDTMLAFAGCASIPADLCTTAPGGALPRERFAATSHVVDRARVDVDALLARVQAAQGSGLTEAGISLDSLGGAVDDLGPADTAFGHRGALATVQYTATYASGPAGPALRYVRGFRRAMTPSWGSGAYVNYADSAITDYQQAYFGDNAERLAEVRAAYDPDGFFTQPQDF